MTKRIAEGTNGATTTYPFTIYNVATSSGRAATITKHIFANGEPVANVQGSTTTAKVYYIHDDALGGANVVSNASCTVQEKGGTRRRPPLSHTALPGGFRSGRHQYGAGGGLADFSPRVIAGVGANLTARARRRGRAHATTRSQSGK